MERILEVIPRYQVDGQLSKNIMMIYQLFKKKKIRSKRVKLKFQWPK